MSESEAGRKPPRFAAFMRNANMRETDMINEPERARAFRHALGLTMRELGELTGYNKQAIWLFEHGRNSEGEAPDPRAWHRYKLACLGVAVLKRYDIASIDQWPWSK